MLGHPDLELANVTKHRVWAGLSATLATLGSTWPSASRTSSGLAQGGRLKPKGLDRNVTFVQDDWPGSARYHGRPIGQWVAWFSPELPWPSAQRVDDCVGCSTREVSVPAHPIAASARQDDRSQRTRPDESRKWASPGTRIHPAESRSKHPSGQLPGMRLRNCVATASEHRTKHRKIWLKRKTRSATALGGVLVLSWAPPPILGLH